MEPSQKEVGCSPDVESARRPVLYCSEIPVPVFFLVSDDRLFEAIKERDNDCSNYNDSIFAAAATSQTNKVKRFCQIMLNDLLRNLVLSKETAEILASCLSKYGILDSRAKVTFYPH